MPVSYTHLGLLELPADATVGQDIREYLSLNDNLLTLKLTPNRADCLSILGIARDVVAITGAPLNVPQITPAKVESQRTQAVLVNAPQACPAYYGRVIEGVNAQATTPDWMVRNLERSGVRSINAIVDITNYVLLELGQPMHAFVSQQHIHGFFVAIDQVKYTCWQAGFSQRCV